MGPPTPQALGSAIREACKAAGITQKQIADAVDRDQTTVSAWVKGDNWPPIWALPVIDRLCGRPRGHLLRLIGYVDDDLDIEAALAVDPSFPDPDDRDMMVRFYKRMREASIARAAD